MKTFEDICPMWDNAIKTKGLSTDYIINKTTGAILTHEEISAIPDPKDRSFRIAEYDHIAMDRPNRCIIGESYGFTDDYCRRHTDELCVHCAMLGNEFSRAIKNNDTELFDILKKDFVEHWNDDHN